MAKTEKRGRGRPAYVPEEKDRKQVLTMAGIGLTQDQIAKIMGISDETLRRNYKNELETGTSRMNAMVAQNLYSIATSKGQGSVAAAIFWMKTRARWQEVNRNEITGADGAPLDARVNVININGLEFGQRQALKQLLLEAKQSSGQIVDAEVIEAEETTADSPT